MTSSKAADIEAILLHRFPLKWIYEAAASAPPSWGLQEPVKLPNSDTKADTLKAQVDTLHAQLNAMPADQVARLAEAAREKQRADAARRDAERQAKLAAQAKVLEASRFYNQAGAMADFAFWCKADFWTLEEATALMLGRDPRVVTPDALQSELKQSRGFLGLGEPLKPVEFHRAYDGLRKLMERAEALASPRLKPRAVLDWAQRTGAIAVPAKLEAALSAFEAATNGPIEAGSAAGALPQPAVVASRSKGQEWTKEELEALGRCKATHGTKATAEKYGMSETRVRKLVPSQKAAPATSHHLDAWVHRTR